MQPEMNGQIPQPMQPQMPSVPPGPVPTMWNLAMAQTPQGTLVVLQFSTASGQSVFFLDPDGAQKLIDGLTSATAQARSGLVIAR